MLPIYTRTQGPASEPISVPEALAWLRVDLPDEVPVIQAVISAARVKFEDETGRALISQEWKATMNAWPSCCGRERGIIMLERAPLISVESVKYLDSDGVQQTLSTDSYRVILGGNDQYGFIELKDGEDWPDLERRSDAIEIAFTAGYGATAASVCPLVIQGLKLLTSHFVDTLRSGPANVGNIVTEIPQGLESIILQRRVGGFIA